MRKIYFLLLMLFSIINAKSQTLLTESFEGTFPPTGWALVNNGSGNAWTQNTSSTYASSGTKSMRYAYNSSNAADAWAFTPALSFSSGTSYRISYFYRVYSSSYAEKLKVTLGTAQTVAAVTNTLIDHGSLTNTTFTESVVNYTATSNGDYYIGFQCYSIANQWNLYVDSVVVQQLNNCTGTPSAGTISAVSSVCSGLSFNITATGYTTGVGGVTYRWQSSSNGTTWNNTSGTNPASFTTSITADTYFRLVDTCTASNQSSISNVIQVLATQPIYATLPFTESFEATWIDGCGASGSKSTPNNSWRNNPTSGNNSWRRNDETTTNSGWSSTSGGYSPTFSVGAYSARIHTYSTSSIGTLDLFVDCSSGLSGKQLSFDYINTSGTDSLTILLSTDGGNTFTRLDSITTRAAWSTKTINFTSGSATTILRFSAKGDYGTTDIGLDNVNVITLNNCTGTPTAGTISAVSSICSGFDFSLTATGYTNGVGGMTYRWQSSPNGSTWTNTSETNPASFTTSINSDTYFRLVDTCTASNQSSVSNVIQILAIAPTYAILPFAEGFESTWIDGCGTKDLPSSYWRNKPFTTDSSWRREDDAPSGGNTAVWTNPTSYAYSPAAAIGSHSARFHSGYVNAGKRGLLDLYIDCSTGLNTKQLSFYYINTSGSDSLVVYLSTDGGSSFTRLDSLKTRAAWSNKVINFTSGSATTVLRFAAVADFGSTDIGIDSVNVITLNNCSGTPTAGTISAVTSVCSGSSFSITATGYTPNTTSGLSYRWQSSNSASGPWTNTSGTNPASFTTAQTAATYYRLVDSCSFSGQGAASNVIQVTMNAANLCYCNPTLGTTLHSGTSNAIDSVSITGTTLNNNNVGIGSTSGYTLFPQSGSTTTTLNQGVSYSLVVKLPSSSIASVWIDYNQNGTYETSEWTQITTTGSGVITTNINVPSGAILGTTGMRIRTRSTGSANGDGDACTTFASGETEEYLITIAAGTSCSGSPTAGTISGVVSACSTVAFTLTGSGYTSGVSGMTYRWQSSSSASGPWTDLSGTNPATFTTSQTTATYYRLVDTCTNSGQAGVSNVIQVTMNAPLSCYCTPTINSSCTTFNDHIETFKIGGMSNANSGCNGNTNSYIAYSSGTYTTTLNKGSSYADTLISGTGSGTHGAAVWIDFNQNGLFNDAGEFFLISNSITASSTVYGNVTIPTTALTGQTRMRVRYVYSATLDSSYSCTTASYGETEDYTITIDNAVPVSLQTFSGYRNGIVNNLQWTTATEINNAGFELQRSADGRNFNKIAYVETKASNGNSTQQLSYVFNDTKPFNTTGYYRLKQIDKDGKSQLSNIVVIKGVKVTQLELSSVYPNPTNKEITVALISPKADNISLVIYDITGKVVLKQNKSIMLGDNLVNLNVASLANGTYTIKAICNDGCETALSKFVKF